MIIKTKTVVVNISRTGTRPLRFRTTACLLMILFLKNDMSTSYQIMILNYIQFRHNTYIYLLFFLPQFHTKQLLSHCIWATHCSGEWFSILNKSVKWMIKWITHVSHLFLYWMNQYVVRSNESVQWFIHKDNPLSPPTGVTMNSNILKYLLNIILIPERNSVCI